MYDNLNNNTFSATKSQDHSDQVKRSVENGFGYCQGMRVLGESAFHPQGYRGQKLFAIHDWTWQGNENSRFRYVQGCIQVSRMPNKLFIH